jgi:hypothetical protein
MNNRLTTREAAERLGLPPKDALPILKAANTLHTRMGWRGPILWDADAVERLKATLGTLGERANG